jgi:hypothetical protein
MNKDGSSGWKFLDPPDVRFNVETEIDPGLAYMFLGVWHNWEDSFANSGMMEEQQFFNEHKMREEALAYLRSLSADDRREFIDDTFCRVCMEEHGGRKCYCDSRYDI